MAKKYSKNVDYEKKLSTVMERLGVGEFNYDWTRQDCFIEFTYKGQFYRFEHSFAKAEEENLNVVNVKELFARLVLDIENLADDGEKI